MAGRHAIHQAPDTGCGVLPSGALDYGDDVRGNMVRGARSGWVATVVTAGALVLSGCASFPAAPDAVGQGWPATGVPGSVRWSTDWIDAVSGESEAVTGRVVGLRLEFVADRWVWRLRSVDAGPHGLLGEAPADPDDGVEALVDATSLALVRRHDVTLTDAESAPTDVSAFEAAQSSGEEYPGPRLVELERIDDGGAAAWRVTTYSPDTGALSARTVPDGTGPDH